MTFEEDLRLFRDSLEQALAHRVTTLNKEEVRLQRLDHEPNSNEDSTHVAVLDAFLEKLHLYVAKSRYYSIPHALLQYTISAKRLTIPQKRLRTVFPPSDSVMTPAEMSSALASFFWTDEDLARSILSLLTRKCGLLSTIQEGFDTPSLKDSHLSPEEAVGKAAHVFEQYFLSLQGKQLVTASDSLSAIRDALLFFKGTLSDLDYLASTASFIRDDFFTRPLEDYNLGLSHSFLLTLDANGNENTNFDEEFHSDISLLKKHIPEDEYCTIRSVTRLHNYHIVVDAPYQDPDLECLKESLPALKEPLRDLTKIQKIAMITADYGCIDEKDVPLFFFRLCGNCRPEELLPISWHTLDNKNEPGKIRMPNEFFFLLHHMYDGTCAENAEKILRFFAFEPEVIQTRVSAILQPGVKTGTAQYATSARREFKRLLHDVVDEDIFPNIP